MGVTEDERTGLTEFAVLGRKRNMQGMVLLCVDMTDFTLRYLRNTMRVGNFGIHEQRITEALVWRMAN